MKFHFHGNWLIIIALYRNKSIQNSGVHQADFRKIIPQRSSPTTIEGGTDKQGLSVPPLS
ncbi:MAG: hypothetical protein EX330_04480 [Candidatus Brocadia sp. BROELEC01]|nr:hypothetical protein [Candidatus Brocadia sapporoensis]QQR66266.1 MAG: hypothetical protein IPI25_12205 [Candidatus Brocadia sp.]RZV58578.1 MAG: hypothetical protein EX330_04480 [Candidatus Brocadia sp. BROELEC01]